MQTGDIVTLRGFFTEASWLRSQSSSDVERLLGYRSGRLSDGWFLLFMLAKPGASEFELRGYSQMSGGVAQGHLPSPPDPRNSEQRLRDEGYDLVMIKTGLITNTFQLDGPKRLAKVIPLRGEFGANDYPPGKGIPQWALTVGKPFKVAALIGPGDMYLGQYK